jgi:hypothetical protein
MEASVKRWLAVTAPLAVVLAVNVFAGVADNNRVAWRDLVRACGTWGTVIFAVTALGAALLAVVGTRRPGAWMVLLPTLPPLTAALRSAYELRGLRAEIDARIALGQSVTGYAIEDWVRTGASDAGLLRTLAAQQSTALALAALVVAGCVAPWPRARIAPSALAALPLAAAYVALSAYVNDLNPLATGVSRLVMTLVALSVVLPALLAPALRRPPVVEVDEASDSTPYRELPAESPSALAFDAPSTAVMLALLLPWIARGYTRGLVAIEAGWRSVSELGWGASVNGPPALRDALLGFAWRWDRAILPLGFALALVALYRGLDRRAARVGMVALALLALGDRARVVSLESVRASILRVAPPVAFLSSPGMAWLADAPDPSATPREELIWRASGAVALVPASRRSDVWRVGPLVHVEPHTRADVWRAHLRRWRATARDGFLTFSGRSVSAREQWFHDPRQEVDLCGEARTIAAHAILEVAPLDPSSAPPSRTLLVTGHGIVVVRDPARGELVPFDPIPSDVMRVTLLPARDDVTADVVVDAAIRLQDGRRRVLLGY